MPARPIFLILFLCYSFAQSTAQTKDQLLWTSFKIQQKINAHNSWALAPIFRFNSNVTTYQNASLDLSFKRQIAKTWSLQLLSRTWFVPTQTNRQFLWLDLAYSSSLQQIKVNTRLRWHQAFNLKERLDPDYLRWQIGGEYRPKLPLHLFLQVELWLRLNQRYQFQRLRIEPGLKYQINPKLQVYFLLRQEQTLNLRKLRKDNIYVLTLNYRLRSGN